MLTPSVKLWLKKNSISVIGEGRVQLLQAVQVHGSIAKAAEAMNMSYRHAWGIIKHIQNSLGDEIVKTKRGGRFGGGAQLTKLGKEILNRYENHAHEIEKVLKYGPRPTLAVDGIIIDKKQNLVLIRRKYPPFKGKLALPGGFVEYNETTEEAVMREMSEELGIETNIKRLLGVYSAPNRDPRQHVISVVYELEPLSDNFKAGDDAKSFEKVSIKNISHLKDLELAFDHTQIITDYFLKNEK